MCTTGIYLKCFFSFTWTLVLRFCPRLCYYYLARVQYIYSPLKKVTQDLWPPPQVLPPSPDGVQLFYNYLVLQSVQSLFFCLISDIWRSKSWTMVFSVAAIHIRLLPVINCELRYVCSDPGYATGQRSPDP